MNLLLSLGLLVSKLVLCIGLERQIIDLSHRYDGNGMWYPGDFDIQVEVVAKGWHIVDGQKLWIEYNNFCMPEHLGTHLDAPGHISLKHSSWKLHEIPLNRFIGPAAVIDISYRIDINVNPNAALEVADIVQWESQHGPIADGSIVLVNTGWDKYWGDLEKYVGNANNDESMMKFPGISIEAAQWLVNNRNIYGVGLDTLSVDRGSDTSYTVHTVLSSGDVYGIENVHNLDLLPPTGAEVHVMPLNLYNTAGGPARVFAFVEQK